MAASTTVPRPVARACTMPDSSPVMRYMAPPPMSPSTAKGETGRASAGLQPHSAPLTAA